VRPYVFYSALVGSHRFQRCDVEPGVIGVHGTLNRCRQRHMLSFTVDARTRKTPAGADRVCLFARVDQSHTSSRSYRFLLTAFLFQVVPPFLKSAQGPWHLFSSIRGQSLQPFDLVYIVGLGDNELQHHPGDGWPILILTSVVSSFISGV